MVHWSRPVRWQAIESPPVLLCSLGSLFSTEVALSLLTQQSRAQILALRQLIFWRIGRLSNPEEHLQVLWRRIDRTTHSKPPLASMRKNNHRGPKEKDPKLRRVDKNRVKTAIHHLLRTPLTCGVKTLDLVQKQKVPKNKNWSWERRWQLIGSRSFETHSQIFFRKGLVRRFWRHW